MLGHELVHAFQYDITGRGGTASASNIPDALHMPLWFIEGMAEYLSVGPVDPHTAMWMRDAARREKLPTDRAAQRPALLPVPLRPGAVGVRRRPLGRRGGGATRSASAVAAAGPAERSWSGDRAGRQGALEAVAPGHPRRLRAGLTRPRSEPDRLRRARSSRRRTRASSTSRPRSAPTAAGWCSSPRRTCSRSTCTWPTPRPARSSGKLVETAVRPALREPAVHQLRRRLGRRRPPLRARRASARASRCWSILNAANGRASGRSRFETIGEITDPTWSPDGQQIAFSAMVGGFTDLYVYDLRDGKTRRLTERRLRRPPARVVAGRADDRLRHRPLHDATWRPAPGNYRLAAIDPASGDDPGAAQLRGGRRTSTRSGPRTGRACTSSPTATASRTCTAWTWARATSPRSPTSSPASAASPP